MVLRALLKKMPRPQSSFPATEGEINFTNLVFHIKCPICEEYITSNEMLNHFTQHCQNATQSGNQIFNIKFMPNLDAGCSNQGIGECPICISEVATKQHIQAHFNHWNRMCEGARVLYNERYLLGVHFVSIRIALFRGTIQFCGQQSIGDVLMMGNQTCEWNLCNFDTGEQVLLID